MNQVERKNGVIGSMFHKMTCLIVNVGWHLRKVPATAKKGWFKWAKLCHDSILKYGPPVLDNDRHHDACDCLQGSPQIKVHLQSSDAGPIKRKTRNLIDLQLNHWRMPANILVIPGVCPKRNQILHWKSEMKKLQLGLSNSDVSPAHLGKASLWQQA